MVLLRLMPLIFLTGCGWNWNPVPDESYGRADRLAAGATVGCAVADVYTTERGLDRGASEINPFYKHGGIPFKIATTYLINVIAKNTKQYFGMWVVSGIQCGTAVHNNGVNR